MPVSMHGLHTEHTAADNISEHTDEELDSESNQSEDSNATEMFISEFNKVKFETKTTEEIPDKEGNMKKKVMPLERRLNS